jgi:hypothetical protein
MGSLLTLVIHGTFARHAKWWRLGNGSEASFADRLERELSRRGVPGTVWKPALDKGFDYDPSFCWSGRNQHRDRVLGARVLSTNLNELAQRVQATPSEPLIVNFVAHSHGGNVVLAALRRLGPSVSVGRVVLLGTPLVTVAPALRLARLVFSIFLFFTLLAALGLILFVFGSAFFDVLQLLFIDLRRLLFAGQAFEAQQLVQVWQKALASSLIFQIPWAVYFLILYPFIFGWLFWTSGNILDCAWRVICRVLGLFGRLWGPVYGPSPQKLTRALRGSPILLLTTHNDEADVLLQVACAPERLYREYVATKFSRLGRLLDSVFLRPIMLGGFLKAVEVVIEVFSLGFPVWRTLVQDFELASLAVQPYYPAKLLVHQWLDIRPIAIRPTTDATAALVSDEVGHDETIEGGRVLVPKDLRLSLGEVTGELIRQVRLRHSAYYENEKVIGAIADFLAGAEVSERSDIDTVQAPSTTLWSSGFSEVLLVANVGLALALWMFPPLDGHRVGGGNDVSRLWLSTLCVAVRPHLLPRQAAADAS